MTLAQKDQLGYQRGAMCYIYPLSPFCLKIAHDMSRRCTHINIRHMCDAAPLTNIIQLWLRNTATQRSLRT